MQAYRIIVIVEATGKNPIDAMVAVADTVRNLDFKVESVFPAKDKLPKGWLGATISQITGT